LSYNRSVCTTEAHIDSDEICERCSKIPWVDGPPDLPYTSYAVDVERPDGCKSRCRICRLIASCNAKYAHWETVDESLLRLAPQNSIKRIIRLSRHADDMKPSGWSLLVSDLTPERVEVSLGSLMLPLIPFSRIKACLDECVEQHEDHCSLKQCQTISHLNLIDCITREVVAAPAVCEYVALSYVWGSDQSTDEDLTSLENPPRTIEQSMLVTRELGFRFLWVDRYVGTLCLDFFLS
jgi:hypothetical protein